MAPLKADVRDADDWWHTLSEERRVSTHRWLTGQSKTPPKPLQTEALFEIDSEGNLTKGVLDDAR